MCINYLILKRMNFACTQCVLSQYLLLHCVQVKSYGVSDCFPTKQFNLGNFLWSIPLQQSHWFVKRTYFSSGHQIQKNFWAFIINNHKFFQHYLSLYRCFSRGSRTAFVPPFTRSSNEAQQSAGSDSDFNRQNPSGPRPTATPENEGSTLVDERLKQFDQKIIDLIMSEARWAPSI